MAVQVELSKLPQLPTPFIAHFKSSKGEYFRLITSVEENSVKYSDNKNKKKVIIKEDFQKEWSGIVLLAEADEDFRERNYDINLKKERRASLVPLLYIGFGLLFTGLGISLLLTQVEINTSLKTSWTFLLVLKYTGLIVTLFLLSAELGQASSLLKRVCGGRNKKVNCQAVLQSKGASIFPGLSWSEIGFFYFSGGWLYVIIAGISGQGEVFGFLALLSLLSVPFIFYSLYYQWRVLRQWCTLCLTVLAVILLEITSFGVSGFLTHFAFLNQIDFTSIVSCGFSFILPINIWYFLKPQLTQFIEMESEIKSLKRLKFSPSVFQGLHKSQEKMPEIRKGVGIVLEGEKKDISKPEVNLLQVCNPYCSACAHVQPYIIELLERVENLKVNFVFSVTDNPQDPSLLPLVHFLDIQAHDDQKINQSLHDWYSWGVKDYKAFKAKYPINGQYNQHKFNIEEMAKWCDEAGITHTPTFFVNGYLLPDGYFIDDFLYFLRTDNL